MSDLSYVRNNDGSYSKLVQLSGSIKKYEITTLLNAVSVNAGAHTANVTITPGDCDDIWFMVSIDKQPWSVTSTHWGYTSSAQWSSTACVFPTGNKTATYSANAPLSLLHTGGTILGSDATTMAIARNYKTPYMTPNFLVAVYNAHATDVATITLKMVKVWQAGGER